MEIVWIVILLWRFNGRISLEIAWGFIRENMVNQITSNFHTNFTIKSP